MTSSPFCPFCGLAPDYIKHDIRYDGYDVNCPRCGIFRVTPEALGALPEDKKYLLSHVCRTWEGDAVPEISTSNLNALIQRAPIRSIQEKMDWLLALLASNTHEA